jgi:hypothetical protein
LLAGFPTKWSRRREEKYGFVHDRPKF